MLLSIIKLTFMLTIFFTMYTLYYHNKFNVKQIFYGNRKRLNEKG